MIFSEKNNKPISWHCSVLYWKLTIMYYMKRERPIKFFIIWKYVLCFMHPINLQNIPLLCVLVPQLYISLLFISIMHICQNSISYKFLLFFCFLPFTLSGELRNGQYITTYKDENRPQYIKPVIDIVSFYSICRAHKNPSPAN